MYICGFLNLEDLHNTCKQYNDASAQIIQQGFTPVSMVEQPIWDAFDQREEMQVRLKLLSSCEAILVLPNWQDDKLARLEVATAHTLGLEIVKANGTIMSPQLTFYI